MNPPGDISRKSKIYELFSSTKLTIFICIILALESVAGSLLYRGDTAYEGGAGFNIFSSPLFLIPSSLLVVNISICLYRRVAGGGAKKRLFLEIAHGLLVLAIVGLMIDGGFGVVYTGFFPFQLPSNSVYDWRAGEDLELPFSLEVTGYSVVRYPYLLRVGVRRSPGEEKVGLFVVKEGDELSVPGTDLIMKNVRFDPGRKELLFDAEHGGEVVKGVTAGKEGSSPLGNGYVVVPVAFRDFGPRDFIAHVRITEGGRVSEFTVSPNHPAVYDGMNITLIESRQDRYKNLFVGFQITRTPGEKVFWGGAVGFFAFILMHLVTRGRGKRNGNAESRVESAEAV